MRVRIAIVALARRLAIALWRFLKDGIILLPESVVKRDQSQPEGRSI